MNDSDTSNPKKESKPEAAVIVGTVVTGVQSDVSDTNLSLLASLGSRAAQDIRDEAGPAVSSESLI